MMSDIGLWIHVFSGSLFVDGTNLSFIIRIRTVLLIGYAENGASVTGWPVGNQHDRMRPVAVHD